VRRGFSFLIAGFLASQAGNAQEVRRNDAEVSAVIKAALDSVFRTEGQSPSRIVLNDSLMSGWGTFDSARVARDLDRIQPATYSDFKGRAFPPSAYPKGFRYRDAIFQSNTQRDSLSASQDKGVRVDALPDAPFWVAFAKKYPGAWGLTLVSRPGFNREHTEALLWIRHGCGTQCHSEELMLLRKEKGRWKVSGRMASDRSDDVRMPSLRYVGKDAHRVADLRKERQAIADSIRLDRAPRRIRAQVISRVTGRGIAYAPVMILRFVHQQLDTSAHLTTDARGRFELRNPALGGITLMVRCPEGYRSGDIAVDGFGVTPGKDTTLTLRAYSMSPCWNLRPHALESGELSSPRFINATSPTGAEASVYSAILADSIMRGASADERIVAAETESHCGPSCDIHAVLGRFGRSFVDTVFAKRFVEAAFQWKPLNPERMASVGATLLGMAERKYMEDEGRRLEDGGFAASGSGVWRMLDAGHPGVRQVVTFSSVAFNSTGDLAIVEVAIETQDDVEEELVLLRRNGMDWKVIERTTW
jgi:hypothetical protein